MIEPSSECTRCPLHRTALTVGIGGRGEGRVLVVGGAPSAEDDLAGTAFVGVAGQLLEAMLGDAGFAPGDYRLTHAVRCATPKNRKPTPAEVAACRPHLDAEMEAHSHDAVIALGDVALTSLCHVSGIKSKRGQSIGIFHPTYPPAMVLNVPALRSTVVSDFVRVRDRAMPQETIEWTHQGRPLRAPFSMDVETYDETGAIDENMTQIALADGRGSAIVSSDREHARAIVARIQAQKYTMVTHNGWYFDDRKTGLTSEYDTMALAYLVDENQPLSLESLCVKYLGVRGWKEARDGCKLGTDLMKEYNARDAVYTLRLFHHLVDLLGPRIKVHNEIMRPLYRALAECSKRGVFIDGERVEQERVKQDAAIVSAQEKVQVALRESGFPRDAFDIALKTKIRNVPFNPNSTHHVGAVLEFLGFTLPRTDTDLPRTDAETLSRINHPLARSLEDYREATKKMSTYILPYARIAASEDGRAHNDYSIWRTLTGRTSASNRNIQNLDRELKEFFSAPKGSCFVRADYSAIEFWVTMWLAGVARLTDRRLTDPTFDPHTFFASILFSIPTSEVTKAQRQIAKSAHFGLIYLGNEDTLITYAAGMGIKLTRADAVRVVKTFRATYPELAVYNDSVKARMVRDGYVESPTGRRRNTGDVRLLMRGGTFNDAWREAVNSLTQGFATGDIAELGLISCWRAGLPVNMFIHDEVGMEFENEATARANEDRIKYAMIDEPLKVLAEKFDVHFPRHLLSVDITYSTAV